MVKYKYFLYKKKNHPRRYFKQSAHAEAIEAIVT